MSVPSVFFNIWKRISLCVRGTSFFPPPSSKPHFLPPDALWGGSMHTHPTPYQMSRHRRSSSTPFASRTGWISLFQHDRGVANHFYICLLSKRSHRNLLQITISGFLYRETEVLWLGRKWMFSLKCPAIWIADFFLEIPVSLGHWVLVIFGFDGFFGGLGGMTFGVSFIHKNKRFDNNFKKTFFFTYEQNAFLFTLQYTFI